MASFKDESGNDWRVRLDAISLDEIKADHGIDLVDLEHDPLRKPTNDPRILAGMMCTICRDQIEKAGITIAQFVRNFPQPPDAALEALREAVIGFFLSGQSSQRREDLARLDRMAAITSEIGARKAERLMEDPATVKKLEQKADRIVDREIEKLFQTDQNAGT